MGTDAGIPGLCRLPSRHSLGANLAAVVPLITAAAGG